MGGFYAIVSAQHQTQQLGLQQIPDVSALAALGTWRYSQGIYRFDSQAQQALASTLLHGEMPTDVLLRLPEWCLYIETPDQQWFGQPLHGFWCHLESDANTQRRELRFLLNHGDSLSPQILHLGGWTVTEAVDRYISEAKRQGRAAGITLPADASEAVEHISAQIQPLLAMILYLCSDEPEITDREHPEQRPSRPRPTRTKKGWKLFAPKAPKIWQVGEQLGEALRKDHGADPTGRRVKPHLRRAHWHGFWSGPRDGERRFGYKWLPPTVVAAD
jgi:hypothetical protein